MWVSSPVVFFASLVAAQPAPASSPPSHPDFGIVAQAYDRCMATYAVRLTRTAATDAQIFTEATRSCLPLKARLRAAIIAQLPPAEAAELLGAVDAPAEPGFMALLARIRSDRARREGQ